eukprot:1190347-Prorocentrum_minimum.AAC.2
MSAKEEGVVTAEFDLTAARLQRASWGLFRCGRRHSKRNTNTPYDEPLYKVNPFIILLRFTGPPVPITARVHSTPQVKSASKYNGTVRWVGVERTLPTTTSNCDARMARTSHFQNLVFKLIATAPKYFLNKSQQPTIDA